MKIIHTVLFFLFGIYCLAQSQQEYKAVLIPLKFDFQNDENQYRLQTVLKYNLEKAGFQVFYSNQHIPVEINDRCQLLTIDLNKESSFLITKLTIIFRDCYGVEIFRSDVGKSREKEYETAYHDALANAFKTLNAADVSVNFAKNSETKNSELNSKPPINVENQTNEMFAKNQTKTFFAQAAPYGYQLIDAFGKVILKMYTTSNPSVFIALKDASQGVLIAKENQWFFEYYQNNQFISETIEVKF
jgi:hypothetical protein